MMVIVLLLVIIFIEGDVVFYLVLVIGLFNLIMFLIIFFVVIESLGLFISKGLGWLCLVIVGGVLVLLV